MPSVLRTQTVLEKDRGSGRMTWSRDTLVLFVCIICSYGAKTQEPERRSDCVGGTTPRRKGTMRKESCGHTRAALETHRDLLAERSAKAMALSDTDALAGARDLRDRSCDGKERRLAANGLRQDLRATARALRSAESSAS